jgi:hypothetical protein
VFLPYEYFNGVFIGILSSEGRTSVHCSPVVSSAFS